MKTFLIEDVKNCMSCLLAGDSFDALLLADATITTRVRYEIDGHLTKDYLSEEQREAEGLADLRITPYVYVRPLCFDMIKGKQKPQNFRFTFLCPPLLLEELIAKEELKVLPSDVANLTLTLSYASEELRAMSAVTMTSFTMDRSVELAWDAWVESFFKQNNIGMIKLL